MPGHYQLIETEIGTCGLAWSDRGLLAIQLPEADPASTERRLQTRTGAEPGPWSRPVESWAARLRAYFQSEQVDFRDVPLDWTAARPFDCTIYRQLREVPHGTIVTYGELASRAGMEGAARAVGAAMSRNPWPIIVPCHRVIAAGGGTGGFSAHGGRMLKSRLLALEGSSPVREAPLIPGLLADVPPGLEDPVDGSQAAVPEDSAGTRGG